MLGVLAVTAIVSPWVAWGVAAAVGRPFTFVRVYDRVFEVLLVVAVVLAWRGLGLGGARDVGFRKAGWGRDLGRGLIAGVIGLACALAVCAVAGAFDPALRFPVEKTIRKALLGAGAAIAIGVVEEGLFRGVLLRRLGRDLGSVAGFVVTTAIYAGVHVLRARKSAGPFDAWSGVTQTLAILQPLGSGERLPEIVGLALLGALLGWARLRSGGLWLPIGIHAAFVAVFRVGRLFFVIRPHPAWLVGAGWPPLIGGVAGWLAVGVAALVLRRWAR